MPEYQDLGDYNEDSRITKIGNSVCSRPGQIIGFIVENDEKADRYLKKLKAQFPEIWLIDRSAAPGGTVLIRIGGRRQ